ncbi:hypothetical protein DFQ14_10164 [Halopolyspora algeriensis]|uniref:Uncharacterized protein n=1 Tax=Halopolyspora algeriensis TaxID=1500506 RepID=A0A368VWZ7_9ACTN|nr:hypothetical protein [Halopolyspora algeriensis]RCW46728.1 hypothetical protein DFQ14_10164 [Halopolyspora algeriensis]TQM46753.1 hypothetical protein FHU43_3874 [Halopolyspora algeriensis]
MDGSIGSNSALDEILERARRRRGELDAEYAEQAARIQGEIAERERAFEQQQADFDLREAERREAQHPAQAQPQSDPAADSRRQVRAGRFGRPIEETAVPSAPAHPTPRRRPVLDDDWDDDDFSRRSWLR